MGLSQPVTGQGTAHPSAQSSQAPGCGCAAVPVPARHRQHQCVSSQICAFLTGAKALAVDSSQLRLPERWR